MRHRNEQKTVVQDEIYDQLRNPMAKVLTLTTATESVKVPTTTRDLISLTKPRVSSLVILTAAAGLALSPGSIEILQAFSMLAGTVLLVGGANVLNCWMERDTDRLMARTRGRPLPDGRLGAGLALTFGLALCAVSLPMLYLLANPITAALGAIALLTYVLAYTPLKTVHPSALIVGAIPGAIPPLMGWTAVTGEIGIGGLVLFGILFLWQMPHVIGLSCMHATEYEAAGIKVLPAVRGERVAKRHAVLWGALLVPVSLLPVSLGFGGVLYLMGGGVLGLMYLAATLYGYRSDPGTIWGRRLFLVSLVYLPVLFVLLMLDSWK